MFKKYDKCYNFPSYLGCLAPGVPPPPAHAYGLTETDDVVKTVSCLFLLGICEDHNSGEKLIICKDSEFFCNQVSFLFIYLFIQVENVLKMITVYEKFDFLHIFPVMGEIALEVPTDTPAPSRGFL